MYYVEGFRKKNGMYIKEEFYPEPGKLWESVKDLDNVSIEWKGVTEPKIMEEMLSTYLKILEKLGLSQVDVVDTASRYLDEEDVPENQINISSIKGELLEELAGRLAINEIELLPPKSWKGGIATFTCYDKPNIFVRTSKDLPEAFKMPLEEHRHSLCLHIGEGKLVMHKTKMRRGRRFFHCSGEIPYTPPNISKIKDSIELEWPELGLVLSPYSAGMFFMSVLGAYRRWLLETERFEELRKLSEWLKRNSLIDEKDLEEIAKEALEQLKRCEFCKEELGDGIHRIHIGKGRFFSRVVFLYELTKEEAREIYEAEEEAIREAEKWADMVITERAMSIADADREAAAKGIKGEVLAPVHVDAYSSIVDIYIGHDAHPIYHVAECIRKHLEYVLRARNLYYMVSQC